MEKKVIKRLLILIVICMIGISIPYLRVSANVNSNRDVEDFLLTKNSDYILAEEVKVTGTQSDELSILYNDITKIVSSTNSKFKIKFDNVLFMLSIVAIVISGVFGFNEIKK